MNEVFDQAWRALSEEILADLNQWQASHPKATFQELEQAIHERTSRLEARALQEAAQARTARDWSHTPERDHPRCPTCGTPLLARGQHVRRLQGPSGQDVTLRRSYGTCPRCGLGLFPLDEELALVLGSLTPASHEHLVHLASWMPFARAAELLERLLGVRVSAATVRRLTEAAGATLEQVQTAASQQDSEQAEPTTLPSPTESKLVLSADGAYVPRVLWRMGRSADARHWRRRSTPLLTGPGGPDPRLVLFLAPDGRRHLRRPG